MHLPDFCFHFSGKFQGAAVQDGFDGDERAVEEFAIESDDRQAGVACRVIGYDLKDFLPVLLLFMLYSLVQKNSGPV